jgi:hypothetical protein
VATGNWVRKLVSFYLGSVWQSVTPLKGSWSSHLHHTFQLHYRW